MKQLLKSKIFWTQIISAVLGLCAVLTPDFLSGLGFKPENTAVILTAVGSINTILTIIFRSLQKKSINEQADGK